MPIDNSHRYLDQLKQLVLAYTENYPVKIILFGSYAKSTAHRYSDIDIALSASTELPSRFIIDLKEKIENSTIPYHVDVIDLSQVDENFRNTILNEGILWKD